MIPLYVDFSSMKRFTDILIRIITWSFTLPLVGKQIKNWWGMVLWDSDLSELFRWSSIVFFFKMSSLPIWLATSLIISRWYGADSMGLYWLLTTIVWILLGVCMLWLGSAMPRFLWESRANNSLNESSFYRTSVRLIILSWLIFSCILFFSSSWISYTIFNEPRLFFPLQITSLFLLPLMLRSLNGSFLLASKKLFYSELVDKFLVPLVMFGIVFISYWLWPTYYIPIWGYLLAGVIWFLSSLYILRKYRYVSFTTQHADWKKMLKISMPMIFVALWFSIMQYTDILMLGKFNTVSDVWVYKIIVMIAQLVILPYLFIAPILGPKISELYWWERHINLQRIIAVFWKIISRICLFMSIILIVFGSYIIQLFWNEFLSWLTALYILIWTQLFNWFTATNWTYMNTCGKEKTFALGVMLTALVNIAANYLLIPLYWVTWAALATWFSLFCFNIWWVYYIWKTDRILTLIF